jgi:A/G-specific adenine glycosylase
MMMPPTSAWSEEKAEAFEGAPGAFDWKRVGEVRHVFTHFALRLDVWTAEASSAETVEGEWIAHEDALAALPTVGRKAVALVVGKSGKR